MDSKPRIMHVIDHTASGGTQGQMSIRIKDLRDDYDFSIVVLGRTGRFSKEYHDLGIPVYELGGEKDRWNPGVFFPLLRLVRQEKPDIIHAHLFKSMILAPLGAWLSSSSCILHDHSGVNQQSLRFYFPKLVNRITYSLALNLAVRLSSHIVVFTESAENDYIQEFNVEKSKIDILPNSIDLDPSPPGKDEVDLHKELNLSDKVKIIMMVGRLSPEKDWLTFLKVAVEFMNTSEYAFIIVGSGNQENCLRDYSTRNGITNVYFLGERLDVPALLNHADAFLLTSRQEAFGRVILEAMAAGCPVISSRTPGANSIIKHEQSGLLVDIGDVHAFAGSLDRIFTDPVLCRSMVDNARISLEKYSSVQISAKLGRIYEQVIHDKSHPSR